MAYPWNKAGGASTRQANPPPSNPIYSPNTPLSSSPAQQSYTPPERSSPVQSPGGLGPLTTGRLDSGRQLSNAGFTPLTGEDAKRKNLLDEETKARVQVDLDKESASQKAVKETETRALQASQTFASDCTKALNLLTQEKAALDRRLRDVADIYTRTEGELKTLAGLRDFVTAGELGEVRNDLETTVAASLEGIQKAGEGLTTSVEASLAEMMQRFGEEMGRMEGTAQDLIGKIQAKRYQ